MPRISEKRNLCESIANDCLIKVLKCTNVEEQNEEIAKCIEQILIVLAFRYSVPFELDSVKKSKDWCTTILPNLDEDRFKSMVRVNFSQFDTILMHIMDDPVFTSKHSSKQMSPEMQLAIVLYRLGSSGEGSSIRKIATLFGCGDGGTINIVTHRVFTAILNKKDKFIFWPKEEERKAIAGKTFDELPHCIGYVDGTEVRLAEKPSWDPDSYYSRKQQFSLKAQVICDHEMKIRHVICGFPGSVHDQRMFSYSCVDKKSADFFKGVEWIAGDSAYSLKPYILTPFKRNSGRVLTEDQKKFNTYFSKYRVRIEHTFAILKEKFNSLKELKIRITDKKCVKFACEWITVCCILYNILLSTEDIDNLPAIEEENYNDNSTINDEALEDNSTAGENKRKALLEILIQNKSF